MKDFLNFKTMITPAVIQVLFWIGVVGCIVLGIMLIVEANSPGMESPPLAILGVLVMFLGPLFVRVGCEMTMVFFSINDHIAIIRDDIERHGEHSGTRVV
ncbi:DUF4282 domain-containing protein [Candidatus Bipolaricaulota bacterium]|nr:DUF4282 domain-containing protein [Candidatus Bipolaricaulota bacterium]